MADTTKKKEKKSKELFDRFGEFNSYKELNLAAEGQLQQGDMEALKELASENGIDKYDVEDYMDGVVDELTTVYSAAAGRLEVQSKEIRAITNALERSAYNLVLMFTREMCNREDMAIAVMRKGKRVKSIFDAMKDEASKHRSGNVGISCGTDEQLRRIIRSYYLDSEQQFKNNIKALYK